MRRLLIFLLLGAAFAGCDEATTPAKPGRLVVYVYFDETGLPDHKVELLDSGESAMTDKYGLAEFTLEPGSHRVRVFDINQGGPCCAWVDFEAAVVSGETSRLEVPDCLPCMTPTLREF